MISLNTDPINWILAFLCLSCGFYVWHTKRYIPDRKRKEKPKRSAEGQWVLWNLYETQAIYGHAYRVFVLAELWDCLTVAEQDEVKELLTCHKDHCLKVTKHGRSTMSIVQSDGLKLDFNYGKKKRGNS
jgi:hypothetical protein